MFPHPSRNTCSFDSGCGLGGKCLSLPRTPLWASVPPQDMKHKAPHLDSLIAFLPGSEKMLELNTLLFKAFVFLFNSEIRSL